MFSLLAATYLGIPIALVIHALEPRSGLGARGLGVLYTFMDLYRTEFLSRSLFSRLIAIRSLDPTLGL